MSAPTPRRTAFDTLSPPIPRVGRFSASPFSPSASTSSSASRNPNKNSMNPPPRPPGLPGLPAPRFKPNAAFGKLLHTSPVPRTIAAAFESSRPQAKKPVGGYSVLSGFGAGSAMTTVLPRPVPILQRQILSPPKVEEKGQGLVKTFFGSASGLGMAAETVAAQLEREVTEGEARSAAKRTREEESAATPEEVKEIEKLPSTRNRKSLLEQAMEQHEELSLPSPSSLSVKVDAPPPADAAVDTQMGDANAAQEEIQSAPPPEKRRKISANAAPAKTPKVTSRAPRPPRAIGPNTMRTPSTRSARPTQATEETPVTRSAKPAPTTHETPTMGTASPELRPSSRLKSYAMPFPVATMKSPVSTSKIPTSASKTSAQRKLPTPGPATSAWKRNHCEEEATDTDIYDFVDAEPVSPPRKKSLPVPATTRRTRREPEIPEIPATASVTSTRKSSTTQEKTTAEPRPTRSVNPQTPLSAADATTKTSTSRRSSLPQRSALSMRTAGRSVMEPSKTPGPQGTPASKKHDSSSRTKNRAIEKDEEIPEIPEPPASETPATKKSLPRRTNSTRHTAVDKDQEIPKTPESPELPATQTALSSLPQPTTTSSRRTKHKAVAIEEAEKEQESPQRSGFPDLLPPPSAMTPAARKALLQRTTSTRRKSTEVEEDPAAPVTGKPARRARSSGCKKVSIAEDEIPEAPATTTSSSKIPTSRSIKRPTAASTKPMVAIQPPAPPTTTPPAGRPRRSLVLSPLSQPPPTEISPPMERSIKSRIPRRPEGIWEGKGGLYNIPAEILASHGSVWDGKSGRRVSGRTNAISLMVVEEALKSVQKKKAGKTEKVKKKVEKKVESKKKVVSYEFSDEEE